MIRTDLPRVRNWLGHRIRVLVHSTTSLPESLCECIVSAKKKKKQTNISEDDNNRNRMYSSYVLIFFSAVGRVVVFGCRCVDTALSSLAVLACVPVLAWLEIGKNHYSYMIRNDAGALLRFFWGYSEREGFVEVKRKCRRSRHTVPLTVSRSASARDSAPAWPC